MPYSYYYIRGNEDLVPEYYWSQEIGIKRKNCTLTFYKYDYDNLIVLQPNTDNYYTPQNIASWQTIGVEGHCEVRIRLSNHSDTTSITEIAAGYSGNYLFKVDSLSFIPKGNSSIFISFKRKTERFALDLKLQEQFVGVRQDIYGQEVPLFRILSAVGTVRFLTLSFILRFDNILDEHYAYIPDYTMAPRHLNFTVKWEFWD
jgi:outer membrane cobalamin receptor